MPTLREGMAPKDMQRVPSAGCHALTPKAGEHAGRLETHKIVIKSIVVETVRQQRDLEMLDSNFFHGILQSQVREMGDDVTCKIHLHDGSVFRIRSIESAESDYLVSQVHHPEATDSQSTQAAREKRKKPFDPEGSVKYDRLAIPYSGIKYVLLTVTEHEDRPKMGFVTT